MKKISYHKEQDIRRIKKIREIIGTQLPFCAREFFTGIEPRTTTQTRLNYARDLDMFFDFLSKAILYKEKREITLEDLDTLTVDVFEAYLAELSCFEYNGQIITNSTASKARKHATVRSFFKYFYNKDKLSANVPAKIPLPRIKEKPIIRLNKNEVSELLDKTENLDIKTMTKRQKSYNENLVIRDVAILTLFLGTGIRISECVGLNLSDFDFANKVFKVTRKGGNQSFIYFTDEVAYALADYIAIRDTVFDIKEEAQDALFISTRGTRLGVRAIENIVKKYSSGVVPIKNISPHKLRSTFGTQLYHNTRDIFVVAEVLGHSDVNTTKKYYADISEEIKREAAKSINLRDDTNE